MLGSGRHAAGVAEITILFTTAAPALCIGRGPFVSSKRRTSSFFPSASVIILNRPGGLTIDRSARRRSRR